MGKKTKLRVKTHKDVEIRYNDDGTVDEIIVKSESGVCLLHLEQMAEDSYWIGLASPDGDVGFPVHVDMFSDARISARVRV